MNVPRDGNKRSWNRPNDLWQCSADEHSSCGGTGLHAAETANCLPQPSLRLRRGAFALACTALVTGILVALLCGPARNDLLSPGPLAHAHARMLVGNGARKCSSCHGAGDHTLTDWIRDAVSSGRHIAVSQSQLCMDCHNQSLLQQFALLPHNVAPERLAAITAASSRGTVPMGLGAPVNERGELACASCHREHHGTDFNLAALTDQQCQTCHASHIHSFETNHPDFHDWPVVRTSSIRFDHNAHALKHFPGKEASFDCRACHVNDARGNVKLVAPFEISCAKCHSGQVYGEESSSWTFFQLPMLDTAALAGAGHPVGDWPAACEGDFDGAFPAPMKLLLAADPEVLALLNRYGPDFQWSDIDPANPEHLADAARLVWAVKRLLLALSVSTQSEIRERIERALGESGTLESAVDWEGLVLGLSPADVAEARQRWLPELQKELTLDLHDTPGEKAAGTLAFDNAVFGRPARLARKQDDDSVLAENPLARLLNGEPDTGPPTTTPEVRHVDAGSDTGTVRNPYTESPPVVGNEELLTENPLASGAPLSEIASSIPVTVTASRDPAVAKLPDPAPGGWYRNDRWFSISYKATRHEDPVLKNWIDVALRHADAPAVRASTASLLVADAGATGACLECHAVSGIEGGHDAFRWSLQYRDTSVREFTRFSHAPHDIQSDLTDCTRCHQLNNDAGLASAVEGAGEFASDFAPLLRASCAACHRKGGAPSGCVDCHNYHVGSKVVE